MKGDEFRVLQPGAGPGDEHETFYVDPERTFPISCRCRTKILEVQAQGLMLKRANLRIHIYEHEPCALPISKLINTSYFFKYLLYKEARNLEVFCVKVRALIEKKRKAENLNERWVVSDEFRDCKS